MNPQKSSIIELLKEYRNLIIAKNDRSKTIKESNQYTKNIRSCKRQILEHAFTKESHIRTKCILERLRLSKPITCGIFSTVEGTYKYRQKLESWGLTGKWICKKTNDGKQDYFTFLIEI